MTGTLITVGKYLLLRLKEIGVDHLFAVPGDFVLGFLNQVLKSDLEYVGTCNELNAAYAADGYARIKGVGAFATTFGVGELSAINGVAGAYAEKVPIVAITGSPATVQFRNHPLLHHTLGDYQTPLKMYQRITVAATQLASGETAPAEIDRVLFECLAHHQPVYISLPSDVTAMACERPAPFVFSKAAPSDQASLEEAIREAVAMLKEAERPLIICDVELVRFHLQKELAEEGDPAAAVKAATSGGAHGVLITAPSLIAFKQGIGMTRKRGTCVLVGLPPGEFPMPLFDVVASCITIRGSFVGTRQGMAEALAFAAQGKVKAEVELQPLKAINHIFERLERGDVAARVVLDFAGQ